MRCIGRFSLLLLCPLLAGAQQVHPGRDIRWPVNCSGSNYMTYNFATNTCFNGAVQMTAGTTTTLPAGSQATVTLRGTFPNYILDFGIPNGTPGGSLSYPGVTSNGSNGMNMGGAALPSGFMQGINVAPAWFSPYEAVNVVAAGAKGDGKIVSTAASITSGGTTVTGLANMTAANVGNVLIGYGAGPATTCAYTLNGNTVNGTAGAAGCPLVTTITGVTNSTTVTVAAAASTTKAGNMTTVIGTDDHDAIMRAQAQACNNFTPSALCVPLKFPRPPNGAFYLTSVLTWQNVSMYGEIWSSGSNGGNPIPVQLRSMPGQDLWLLPDPADTSTFLYGVTPMVQHMSWAPDDSIDVSASHPHRKPGRTLTDGVTNSTANITSAAILCTAGDVGQKLLVTFPDTTTQTATISSCNTSARVPQGNAITIAGATPIATGSVAITAGSTTVNMGIAQGGSITTTAGSGAIVGTLTNFLTQLAVGNQIIAGGETHTVSAITDATHATTDAWTATNSTPIAWSANNMIGTPAVGQVALIGTWPTTQVVTVTAVAGASITLSTPTNCKGSCSTAFASFYASLNAAQSQTGVSLYVAIANMPVTQTVGNCGLAIDNRDGRTAGVGIRLNGARFRDMNIVSAAIGGSVNSTGGICLQGGAGSPYAVIFDNMRIVGPTFDLIASMPYDTNPLTATVGNGGDYTVLHSMKIDGKYPLILYNGAYWKMDQIEIGGGGVGPQILGTWALTYGWPIMWDISISEIEQNQPGSILFRLEGYDHVLRNTSSSNATGGAFVWDAWQSTCEHCIPRAGTSTYLLMGGGTNQIELWETGFAVADDPTYGNLVTGIRQANPGGSVQWSRPVVLNGGRASKAVDKTADFLLANPSLPYLNQNDLWIWPRDILLASGQLDATVNDPTSPTGSYLVMPTSQAWIGTYAIPGQGYRIGSSGTNVPAGKINLEVWAKCPVITSFTLNPYTSATQGGVSTHNFGAQTLSCSTSFTPQFYALDLSPYSGSYLNGTFTTTGEIDIGFIAIIPNVLANGMATNGPVGSAWGQLTPTSQGFMNVAPFNTAVPAWLQFYGDGSDGALSVAAGNQNITGDKWFTTLNVSAGATLTCTRSSIPCIIRATTSITVAGTLWDSAVSGFANVGGTGAGNIGGGGGGGGGGTAAGTAGGNGILNVGAGAAGTSSGGTGGAGTYQASGGVLGDLRKTIMASPTSSASILNSGLTFCGGGGGAGGTTGGAGGFSGCGVILVAPIINISGTIDVTGNRGTDSTANNSGAGGGGGGGMIIIRSPALTNTGTLNVSGGPGGGCTNPAVVLTTPIAGGTGQTNSATANAQAHVTAFTAGNPTTITVDAGGNGSGYNYTPNCAIVGTGGGANTGSGATCTVTMAGSSPNMTVASIAVSGGNGGYGTGTTYTGCGPGGPGGAGWAFAINN